MDTKMVKVNAALSRYYESKGATYDDVFTNFCDENGIDEEGVDDDMNGGYADSIFPDELDDDFPGIPSGKDEKERKEYIFNIIKKCWKNPEYDFNANLPEIKIGLFDIVNEKSIQDIKNIYFKQCPNIYYQGMHTDGYLFTILLIGENTNLIIY